MMKKMILFAREKSTLEWSALFVFVLVLVSNLAVIKFAEGYFEYFDMPLGLINFAPQMYDYARVALPVLIASAIITIVVALLIKVSSSAGEFIADRIKLNKKSVRYIKRHKKFFIALTKILGFIFIILIAVTMTWASYGSTTSLARKLGESSAKNMTRLSSISKPDDNSQEIIIYKGDAEIITKKYDASKKKFLDGYQVTTSGNYQVRNIYK